jgi:hypothetical protein
MRCGFKIEKTAKRKEIPRDLLFCAKKAVSGRFEPLDHHDLVVIAAVFVPDGARRRAAAYEAHLFVKALCAVVAAESSVR